MPRTLPKLKSEKQKTIIQATQDYFGSGEMTRANQIALYLMGRRKGVHLTEEEMSDARLIGINLQDEVYVSNLTI